MKRARGESGFAMLLVFAMAASVAILLYTEMPRVAFEAQRGREQMLIDRGEQYQRAIQLYVRKFQRYPARIEDLENTNNVRFLRRKYPDPMTGKDEWRLIHVVNGVLTDSKVQKQNPQDKDKEKKAENTFITEALSVGSTAMALPGQPGSGPQSPALARRASDRAPVSAASMGQMAGGGGVGVDPNIPQPVDPNQPQQFTPGYPGPPPAPGQTPPYVPGGQQYPPPGVQPGPFPGAQPGVFPGLQPGQTAPVSPQGQIMGFGQPGYQPGLYPNPPASPQTGGQVPAPFAALQQQTAAQQTPGAGPNPALDLIRNLLTSPRQGGPIGTTAQSSGMQIGGGIAGVATKYEAEGIKVYNERTKYDEWEFIYDTKNDRALLGGMGMGAGAIQGMPGMQGMQGQSGFSPFQQQQQMQQQQMQQQQMQQQIFQQPPMTNPGFSPGRGR